MNALSTYAAVRFALDRAQRRSARRPTIVGSFARAFALILAAVILLPVALLQLLASVRPPSRDRRPPHRGRHPQTGAPLRSFQDSLDDLD